MWSKGEGRAMILWCCAAAALAGCGGGEVGRIELDFCLGQGIEEEDRLAVQSANAWELTVWGIRDSNAIWVEEWVSDAGPAGLTKQLELPTTGIARFTVEGRVAAAGGRQELVAVGGSDELPLSSGLRVCICIAPPESYSDACPNWQCRIDYASGSCWP